MKIRSLFSLSFFLSLSIFVLSTEQVFAEGGGGIECPNSIGGFTYANGTATFETVQTEEDELGTLYCEYESESNTAPFGEINVIYHVNGVLSEQLIEEYGCGEKLAIETSPLFVSSETHFAIISYSPAGMIDVANNILSQIEDNDIATPCSDDIPDVEIPEEIQEALEEIVKEIEEEEEVEFNVGNDDEPEEREIDPEDFTVILPEWIKSNAEWWSDGQIADTDFISGIEYMIKEGIIVLPPTNLGSGTSSDIPEWVKFNAGWWSEGSISDDEFVDGLQFLISNGIISV